MIRESRPAFGIPRFWTGFLREAFLSRMMRRYNSEGAHFKIPKKIEKASKISKFWKHANQKKVINYLINLRVIASSFLAAASELQHRRSKRGGEEKADLQNLEKCKLPKAKKRFLEVNRKLKILTNKNLKFFANTSLGP